MKIVYNWKVFLYSYPLQCIDVSMCLLKTSYTADVVTQLWDVLCVCKTKTGGVEIKFC